MRLIDADALKIPSTSADIFENCRNCRLLDEEQVREIIDDEPTIDAVQVVRCKDCRKWTNGDDTYGTCQWNEYRTLQTRFDDFCSYGDRRTE